MESHDFVTILGYYSLFCFELWDHCYRGY